MTKDQVQRIAEECAISGRKTPDFREFYRHHYSPGGDHWAGREGEMGYLVMQRVADAVADFVDFVMMVKVAGCSVEPEVGGDS